MYYSMIPAMPHWLAGMSMTHGNCPDGVASHTAMMKQSTMPVKDSFLCVNLIQSWFSTSTNVEHLHMQVQRAAAL